MMEAILHQVPVPVVRLNPDVPEQLESIIASALRKTATCGTSTHRRSGSDLKRLKRDLDSQRLSLSRMDDEATLPSGRITKDPSTGARAMRVSEPEQMPEGALAPHARGRYCHRRSNRGGGDHRGPALLEAAFARQAGSGRPVPS